MEVAGLGQYTTKLLQVGFDEIETLLEIEDTDLKDVGMPRGHIMKLRRAFRNLTGTAEAPDSHEQPCETPDDYDEASSQHSEDRRQKLCAVGQILRQSLPRHSKGPQPLDDQKPAPKSFCAPLQPKAEKVAPVSFTAPPLRKQESMAPKSFATPDCMAMVAHGAPVFPAEPVRCATPSGGMATLAQESWRHVQAVGLEQFGELVFRDFLEREPEAQAFFNQEVVFKYRDFSAAEEGIDGDLMALRKLWAKVVRAIGFAVASLSDKALVPRLRQLGARHAAYGLSPGNLRHFGQSLLDTLRQCLGDKLSPHGEFAWTVVYGFIESTMAEGLRSVRGETCAASTHGGGCRSDYAESTRSSQSVGAATPALIENEEEQAASEDCIVSGGREEYRVLRHLQKAIFGDVFEAIGLSSGRSFAIKVADLGIMNRFRQLQHTDYHFCECPLSEVKFAESMKGLDCVLQLEDSFADDQCHFLVSSFAAGGDLLEALRLRGCGFPEKEVQLLIRDAAIGLTSLHLRGIAMQDVSLENMLLDIREDGTRRVKICDPGQAARFAVDPISGQELPSEFQGFVGKEFRAPELYAESRYLASKVDAWCLGYCMFELLTGRSLFQSSDPATEDARFARIERGELSELLRESGWEAGTAPDAEDFLRSLLDLNPSQRMSARDALRHPWLVGVTALLRRDQTPRDDACAASTGSTTSP